MLFVIDRAPERSLPVYGRRISPSSVGKLIDIVQEAEIDLGRKDVEALLMARYPKLKPVKFTFQDMLEDFFGPNQTLFLYVKVGVASEVKTASGALEIVVEDASQLNGEDDLGSGQVVSYHLMFSQMGIDTNLLDKLPPAAASFSSLFEDKILGFSPEVIVER